MKIENHRSIPNLVFNKEGPEYVYCVCLSVCPSVCPSVCLSVCLSVRLSVCLKPKFGRLKKNQILVVWKKTQNLTMKHDVDAGNDSSVLHYDNYESGKILIKTGV